MSNRTISGRATLDGEDLGEVFLYLTELTSERGFVKGIPGAIRSGRLVVDDGPFIHEFPHLVDGCAMPDLAADEPEFYIWQTKENADGLASQ